MTALILVVFLGAAVIAIPIAHALLVAAMAAAAASDRVPLDLLVQQMVAQVQSFPLIAIPFFMLTGTLMMGGKLGEALIGVLSALIGRFHGGPGQVGVLSSTIFGGVSGSAVADASAIGSLLIPWQKRLGYPPAFSAATLAAAATIDILIPPSIPMILFALVSNTSIAALFVAGILPGLLMCALFMAVVLVDRQAAQLPARDAADGLGGVQEATDLCVAGADAAGADRRLPALRHRHADRSRGAVDAVRRPRLGARLPRPRHQAPACRGRRGGPRHRRRAAGDHGVGGDRLAAHVRPHARRHRRRGRRRTCRAAGP